MSVNLSLCQKGKASSVNGKMHESTIHVYKIICHRSDFSHSIRNKNEDTARNMKGNYVYEEKKRSALERREGEAYPLSFAWTSAPCSRRYSTTATLL